MNVQPLSGTPANLAVFTALAGKNGKIMGLAKEEGGHFSHGYKNAERVCVSATSLFFESRPYHLGKNG